MLVDAREGWIQALCKREKGIEEEDMMALVKRKKRKVRRHPDVIFLMCDGPPLFDVGLLLRSGRIQLFPSRNV
jgi:hypothetical protein